MGKYTFTWEHAASEVLVTGDFDNWQKTVKLEKEGDHIFKKTVELPKSKHLYKFVVDGNWCTNDSAPKEADGQGIQNNVLTPDDIKDEEPAHTLSSVGPTSTTAALAGAVPKESEKSKSQESVPGAFPETPFETPATEAQAFSVNPIPATEGMGNPIKLAPGEKVPDPSTFTGNTIQSTVKDDKNDEEPGEQSFGVAPIPATAGAGNPIHLAPGEKVPDPSTFTSNTVQSTVKLDADSYEKSDAGPPQLAGPVITPEVEREAKGGMFGLPPIAGNMIPESSLPMGSSAEGEKDPGFTISSVAPTATTVGLAADVPKEPRGVPTTVTESQKEADFAPEASANPEAVQEKKELEQELKSKVPEEPPAAESGISTEKVAAGAAAGVTAAAGAFAAATYAAKDKAAEAIGLNGQATASEVPEVVAESQKEAHASPEASANPEAVEEKKEVESELLQAIKKTDEAGEPAPTVTAATTETAPVPSAGKAASAVPEVVAESQKEAHASPEASANSEALEEKKEVEAEILKEVKKTDETGEPAPVVAAAAAETTPALSKDALVDNAPLKSSSEPETLNASVATPVIPETSKPTTDSRDISPMSKKPTTTEQTAPVVTTGAESSKVEAKSTPAAAPAAPETPVRNSEASSSKGTPGTEDKKKKRRSIFGKLKEKLHI
ncbi:hypothetical protein BCR34DRAFT_13025 [Clohesyomyces aquaticus]|uniref:AMP-activated protein kinase glycogen-binding domain-containing protein n=1 Tax=Clohesyomyces aquaticus TaxID=1231657 RepID=A0A1Y1ZDN2_9PLEO|nr:hypothetical protein BCR34DRAFT_13025 [Clohesyomyces aquaticus]